MTAGRHLDMLVGGHIMGYDMTRPEYFKYPIGMPHYSTDIGAAWQVIENLVERGMVVEMRAWAFGWSRAVVFSGIERHDVEDITAPLAICLAALAAVGAEVPA